MYNEPASSFLSRRRAQIRSHKAAMPSTSKEPPPSFEIPASSEKRVEAETMAQAGDTCDCLDIQCPGCFLPCSKCG